MNRGDADQRAAGSDQRAAGFVPAVCGLPAFAPENSLIASTEMLPAQSQPAESWANYSHRPPAGINPAARSGDAVEIFASGMNGALQRLPKVRCVSLSLIAADVPLAAWRPNWPKLKTIRLTFPDGMEFLP